ncbi:indole-3-glycerol phosphate synthase TrpC [Helicobacter himalayensis]|uniref:indole-3-glycerol phosphate synthase TrpC n=1 Tax=Helicobacter himalayensis TaxID=1591088 RepID=UPI00082D6E17|nr:indole-3-glycerol phosphate synthase TrpC [Helicobacter himalayensis]
MNILEQICEDTKARIQEQMRQIPRAQMITLAQEKAQKSESFAFERALKRRENEAMKFICEVKKASPSKGVIAQDFHYTEIAREYERAGASCISCLTEPKYFLGADSYLQEIREAVSVPLLRKDFTIDSYMIYQARLLGADCVLFICAILGANELQEYLSIAQSLGLSALVEVHNERELQMALDSSARLIGVNNRDLKTFSVDLNISLRLKKLCPTHITFIAESGIGTREDIVLLEKGGVDGVLIGEGLMRQSDKMHALSELRGETKGKFKGMQKAFDEN